MCAKTLIVRRQVRTIGTRSGVRTVQVRTRGSHVRFAPIILRTWATRLLRNVEVARRRFSASNRVRCEGSVFTKAVARQCLRRTPPDRMAPKKNPDQACLSGSSLRVGYEFSLCLVEPLQLRQLLGPMPRSHHSLNLSADLYDQTERNLKQIWST